MKKLIFSALFLGLLGGSQTSKCLVLDNDYFTTTAIGVVVPAVTAVGATVFSVGALLIDILGSLSLRSIRNPVYTLGTSLLLSQAATPFITTAIARRTTSGTPPKLRAAQITDTLTGSLANAALVTYLEDDYLKGALAGVATAMIKKLTCFYFIKD